MSLNIEQEIARRLGVDADAVTPAMEAVIQRIRQQVAHYGYARLAGIGTFRQHDGELRFEADPVLSESVNHRFAGLEPLAVESSAPAAGYQKHEIFHADEPEPALVEYPGDAEVQEGPGEAGYDADEPVLMEGPGDEDEQAWPRESGYEADEPSIQDDVTGHTAAAETSPGGQTHRTTETDEPEDERWEAEDKPEVRPGEESAETEGPLDDVDWEESPEADEQPDERFWEPSGQSEETHPLGPLPGPSYEEADFSIVPEGGDETFEEEEPYVRYEDPELYESEEEDVPSEEAVAGPPLGIDESAPHPEYEDEPPEPTVRWNPAAEFVGEEEEPEPQPDEPPYVRTAWAQPPEPEEEFDESSVEWDAPEPEPEDEIEAEAVPVPEPAIPPPPHSSSIRQRHERPVQRGPSRFVQEQERSRTPWIAGGIIILLAIASAAVFLVLRDTEGTGNGAPEDVTEILPPVVVDTLGAGIGADTTALAEEEPVDEPEETGPLYGGVIDPEAGGWTLVVASETSLAAAERVAERYRQENFRSGVMQGTSGGVTRYRVGVGQFTSLAQAEQYRADLAGDEIPGDAWALAIP